MADNCQIEIQLKITNLKLELWPVLDHVATNADTSSKRYAARNIDTFTIGQSEMNYRAEGNANMVIAMPQRCQVLRLPKICKR